MKILSQFISLIHLLFLGFFFTLNENFRTKFLLNLLLI